MRARSRVAGVTVPLSALWTARSQGVGDIGDLAPFARWIVDAGVRLVQLLPVTEMSSGPASPYSSRGSFGVDPIYVDLGALGIATSAGAAEIDFEAVRARKLAALRSAFARPGARRGLDSFCAREAAWVGDLALYTALKEAHAQLPWWAWPAALARRDAAALERARASLAEEVEFYAFVQWHARRQWDHARAQLSALGVELMGDLPFMVVEDSVDAWCAPELFDRARSLGAPGDAFDAEGQDWALPAPRWSAIAKADDAWPRARVRGAAALYDRLRVDHLIGYFRAYSRPRVGLRDDAGVLVPGRFAPAEEAAQAAQGERVLSAMCDEARDVGLALIGEDLGVIPAFVAPALARFDLPGYRVLFWERDAAPAPSAEDEQAMPDEDVAPVQFVDPRAYPTRSVACFGTHDTPPLAAWWETLSDRERDGVAALCPPQPGDAFGARFTLQTQQALLELLQGAASELTLPQLQDLLGARDRINTPGTVGAHNWRYRLPAPIEALSTDPALQAALARSRAAADRGGRA
ncbi:MAG: 4-alpha-glucanotransferase [Nannocystaceae bacterium]